MFTLHFRGHEEEELTLELPCTQSEYEEVVRHSSEKKPFMLDQEEYFNGVSILNEVSSLNTLAHLAEDAKDDNEDKFDAFMEFGLEHEYCDCIMDWIRLFAQYYDVEYHSDDVDLEEIGTDFMNEECSSSFIEKFNNAGLDVEEIGREVFDDDWDAYETASGWLDTTDYYSGSSYDIPDEFKLELPVMYEPYDLRDRTILKTLLGSPIYRETEDGIMVGRINGFMPVDGVMNVRVLGMNLTAEELMEWKDFYLETPMAKELTE